MFTNEGITTGDITEVIPNIQNILKITEPIAFPIIMSESFFMAAIIAVVISGRVVPIEIIVAEMRN